jgi:hypothetical protein
MAYEHWHCEACKKRSTVRYSRDSGDVYLVRNLIERHHAKKSPRCAWNNGLSHVRVGVPTTGVEGRVDTPTTEKQR